MGEQGWTALGGTRMLGRAPQSSLWCAQGDHERCPHWVGMRVAGLWLFRPRPEVVLCNDPWHRSRHCPLVGRRKAAQDVWSADCTCPGAEASRRSFARSHERRREMDAVMADVDLADHPNAEKVERRLRDAVAAHGQQPTPGLPGMSRVVAAATGPRGTRLARSLWLAVRAAACAVRRAWQPGASAEDQRFFRGMYASLGALVGMDVLLTTLAVRSTGWRRLPWAAAALLGWLFTSRTVAVGALVATVVRTVEGAAPVGKSPAS